ncbi:hypothetical protein AB1P65_09500 [Roseibium alexandrii]
MIGRVDPTQVDLDHGDWQLVSWDPETGRKLYELDTGDGHVICREEYYADEQLLDENKALYNESEGKRWGENGRSIARIPLNVWLEQLAAPVREHDDKYVQKWLNDAENKQWRTFKGNV